jgi:carboxyl-terminal processing protease
VIERNGRDVKVGVITVPSFYQDYDASRAGAKDFRSTTRDVQRLIDELRKEGAEVLIMDLRANGGGYLPEAESLTGLFIDRGPVVQLRDTTGHIEVDDDPDPSIFYSTAPDRARGSVQRVGFGDLRGRDSGLRSRPHHRTANLWQGHGAERASAELHDFGRKPELGQLNVTIGKYYRITGESTQDRGVTPDIALPSLIDANEVGESTRDRALPWDHISPADFKVEGDLKPITATLEKLHDERTKDSPDFAYLRAGHRRARRDPQPKDAVAFAQGARSGARAPGCAAPRARERLAGRARHAAPEVARRDQGRCGERNPAR